MLERIVAQFQRLEDHPEPNPFRLGRPDAMGLTLLATMSGAQGWREISDFTLARLSTLKTVIPCLELAPAPSPESIAEILSRIDPARLSEILPSLSGDLLDELAIEAPGRKDPGRLPGIVSIIGGLAGPTKGERLLEVIHGLFHVDSRRYRGAAGELEAVASVLDGLKRRDQLAGRVVVLEGLSGQPKVAKTILDRGGDYLAERQGDQRELHSLFFDALTRGSGEYVVTRSEIPWRRLRGRTERRETDAIALDLGRDPAGRKAETKAQLQSARQRLERLEAWPGVKTVLRSSREELGPGHQPVDGERPGRTPASLVRYHLTSLALTAERAQTLMDAPRATPMGQAEQAQRGQRGAEPEAMGVIRRLAVNLVIPQVVLNPPETARSIMTLMAECPSYLLAVLQRRARSVGPPADWRRAMGAAPCQRLEPLPPPEPRPAGRKIPATKGTKVF